LSDQELALFQLTSARGSRNWSQLEEFFADCHKKAKDYHAWRRTQSQRRQSTIGADGTDTLPRTRGTFTPSGISKDPGANDVALALQKAGFDLRLVTSSDFKGVLAALPVWVRPVDSGKLFEAQIYGYPVLHTFAPVETEAVAELIALMTTLYGQLLTVQGDGKEPRGPAKALLGFLTQVLERPLTP
jgi:hypothetical protein